MDKYTVDLDQVLNDFEYSELTTEQQSCSTSTNNSKSYDEFTNSQHVKNYSNTKHSMNNVFSSLNEYLNSEINENVEYKDNNYDNNLSYQRSTISSVNSAIAIEPITTTNNLLFKTIGKSDNEGSTSFEEKAKVITPVKQRPLETLIADPILLKLDDDSNKTEEEVSSEDRETLNKIKEIKDEFFGLVEFRTENEDNAACQPKTLPKTFSNDIEEIKKEFLSYVKENEDYDDDYRPEFYQQIDGNNFEKLESSSSLEEESCVEDNSNLAIFRVIARLELSSEEENKRKSSFGEDNLKISRLELSSEEENKRKSSFGEDNLKIARLELSSDEENKRKSSFGEDNLKIVSVEEENSDLREIPPGKEDEEAKKKKIAEDLNTDTKVVAEDENLINSEICREEKDEASCYKDVLAECKVINDSINLNCAKVGFHVEVEDDEAVKYLEELENDEDQEESHKVKANLTISKEDKKIKVKEESEQIKTRQQRIKLAECCETLRPNSLDLDIKDGNEETVNLIGNPGSTPYNNLYVSKEMPEVKISSSVTKTKPIKALGIETEQQQQMTTPNLLNELKEKENLQENISISEFKTTNNLLKETQEENLEKIESEENYDSDSSASVSPTFSEASTDSVHSSDSPILQHKKTTKITTEEEFEEQFEDNNNLQEKCKYNLEKHDDETEEGVEHENDENITLREKEIENMNLVVCSSNDNNERITTNIECGEIEIETEVELEQEDICSSETNDNGDNEDNEDSDVTTHLQNHPISEEDEVYVDLDSINHDSEQQLTPNESVTIEDAIWLGKRAPIWIPDADALSCQHCDLKFTVIKRRHHCRACGLVLCSKCCNMKHKLEYLATEARVCTRCYELLNRETDSGSGDSQHSTPNRNGDSSLSTSGQPNPNNPMEYCSVVPPHQQVGGGDSTPPSVMVPVGVLKRKGSNKKHNKSVMFCDGIRPGSDLTNLDNDFNYNDNKKPSNASSSQSKTIAQTSVPTAIKINKNLPVMDRVTRSFIPSQENRLPPTVTTYKSGKSQNSYKSDITYTECGNTANVVEMLQNETLTFAVQRNLHIHVRLINMDCCVNKQAWCFSTEGLISVGQDEIVILLEYMENETQVPKDIFHHLNNIYNSAVKGTTVTELGLSLHPTRDFLDSRNHAGFIFVRPTFQCLQNVIIPKEPYLVGILVHRWETPWARIFPLRLVLRLGAEYRYYPSPLISTRNRDSVFVEIGHTIINLLADFRNFSYTLPNIRGLTIHMEEKSTTVSIPVNRYDQVMKTISNSSEHILAFGGNFSSDADSHLVCIQDTQGSNENSYKTHAINIQNKPRKVTGASFIVFNGALKSTSGLTAKSSIVEDGLMIQIPPEHMIKVRESLRIMKNYTIQCGCVNVTSDETVNIVWSGSDVNFNLGVKSSVDGQSLSGVPSIRVHNGKDYTCNSGNRLIRWTEVFLLQNGEENARTQDPVDISKVAESISKATCQALVKYLDLLAANSFMKIGIRTTLHVDDVSYAAGSNGTKLPPIYMKSLDNELVPVLHGITSSGNVGDGTIVLELIFRILNV